jgi:hypothetical protein
MVTAFLMLVPLVPYAAFRASEQEAEPAVGRAGEPVVPAPMDPHAPPGASVCPDRGGPSSPLSDRSVRKRSRGWEWKALETPGWKLLMADHFVVRGDVPVEDLRTSAAYLEEFLRTLRDSIGGDPEGIMFSVRIFADERDFRIYASLSGAANAESFYDPRTVELVMCLDRVRGREALQKTLAHEFAHQYMDRVWKRTEPLWFAEGMAEYFANFAVGDGRLRPGAVDRDALRRLTLGEPMELGRFVKLGREEMYGASFPVLYAQAWSVVHYLFSRKDGLVDLLLRGGALEGLDELEKGWKAHLDKIGNER